MSLHRFLRLAPDQDLRFAAKLVHEIDTILTIDYLDTYTVSLGDLGGLEGLTDASLPASIKIAPGCERKSLVFAHEIGHMVDFSRNLGLFTFFGQSSELNELIWAAQESSLVQVNGVLARDHPQESIRRYAGSLLQPQEIWANSFAQYMAKQLPGSAIAAELAASRNMDPDSHILDYWDPLDFEPISDAVERLIQDWVWM